MACLLDVAPDQKYCERHMHLGRPRSRKHVEVQSEISNNIDNSNTHSITSWTLTAKNAPSHLCVFCDNAKAANSNPGTSLQQQEQRKDGNTYTSKDVPWDFGGDGAICNENGVTMVVCGLKWSHDDREIASGGNDNQQWIDLTRTTGLQTQKNKAISHQPSDVPESSTLNCSTTNESSVDDIKNQSGDSPTS